MNLVFDTETTGIINYQRPVGHESQPHIVQLGAQLLDDSVKVKGELNLLIKPDGWTIPQEATNVHHISTEDCEKFGVPIRAALGLFNLWLGFNPLLIAHNTDFDDFLIYKWPKLQETYKFLFGEEFEGAHDAMADVRACARIYFELRNRSVISATP